MANHDKIVKKILSAPEFPELLPLATQIVKKVSLANKHRIVGENAKPDIETECDDFRKRMEGFGFAVPDSNEELYNMIIKRLIFREKDKETKNGP